MNELVSGGLHPAGEEFFEFPTYAGKVTIAPSDDVLTPYGGLVAFAAFLRQTGLLERLSGSCPVRRTSPNAAPVRDILASFLLTALCEGKRFRHVERLREDPTMAVLFGLQSGVGGAGDHAALACAARPAHTRHMVPRYLQWKRMEGRESLAATK